MSVQDDAREVEVRELFGLHVPDDHSRGGTDAVLELDGKIIEFELKSTTKGSVTTVRDFGPDHVEKWKSKHWLIGRYKSVKGRGVKLSYCLYGSPAMMAPWINEKAAYIAPDLSLAGLAPAKMTIDDLYIVLGKKKIYSYEDAWALQKKQYKKEEYDQLMDVDNGYSPERMLQILKDRTAYLLRRGSTLNNPHIPASYFKGWERITSDHSERLIELVRDSFKPEPELQPAQPDRQPAARQSSLFGR